MPFTFGRAAPFGFPYSLSNEPGGASPLTPRAKLFVVLPVIAAVVLVLVYFQLFTSPGVVAWIFVLYVAVSLRNRRMFEKQRKKG